MAKDNRGGRRRKPKLADHTMPIKVPGRKDPAYFVEGTYIEEERVFAGYKQRNKLKRKTTRGLSKKYGGKERLWQHGSEVGIIDLGNGNTRRAEVHWFRNGASGKKERGTFKRWRD